MNDAPQHLTPRVTIALVIAWLIVVNLFALFALNRLNLAPDTAYRWINPDEFHQVKSWNVLNLPAHWDSTWYLQIARDGYTYRGPEQFSNIVFFPLYPALIALLAPVLVANHVLAGWLISTLCLVSFTVLFTRFLARFHPDVDQRYALGFLLAFPTAYFLNAVYTESLFLLLTLATFFQVRRGKYVWAGVLGALAAMTRVTGILLLIPAVMELYASHGWSGLFSRRGVSLLLIPLGTTAFFTFHALAYGDFFLFFDVERWFGRTFRFASEHFETFSQAASTNLALDATFAVLGLVGSILVWRRIRASYGAYMLVSLGVALATGTLMSVGRYLLVLFPLFMLLAGIRRPFVRQMLLFTSTLFLAINIVLFVSNGWAG